jgi:hypothetical protein
MPCNVVPLTCSEQIRCMRYPRSEVPSAADTRSRRHSVTLSGLRTSRTEHAALSSAEAVKILLVGTDRPADEGNILCFRRTSDSIRWIVYELRDGKVEPERGPAGIIAEPS